MDRGFPMIDKEGTGKNLRKIMDARGISAKELQQYLRLGSVQSVYHWLEGKSLPTIDNLYAMSVYFSIPIDELVIGNYGDNYSSEMNAFYNIRYAHYDSVA